MTDDKEMKKVSPATLRAIKKAAREGRIKMMETDRINAIPKPLLDDFNNHALDMEGAPLLTDASQISDFASFFSGEEREKEKRALCTRVFGLYGVRCEPEDYICEVLEKILKTNHQEK